MKSKYVPGPSICLWHRFSLNLLHGLLSQFLVVSGPGLYEQTFYYFFVSIFIHVLLNMHPIGTKLSKRLLLQITDKKFSKLLLNCLPNAPAKAPFEFLALLDYASRAHEIKIRPLFLCVEIIFKPIARIIGCLGPYTRGPLKKMHFPINDIFFSKISNSPLYHMEKQKQK